MVNYDAIRSIVQPTNGSRNRLKIVLMIFAPDCRCVHHVELRLVLQQVATVIHLMRTKKSTNRERDSSCFLLLCLFVLSLSWQTVGLV